MNIELLYFERCPHYKLALELLRKTLEANQILSPVKQINIKTEEMAKEMRFPGSPTIRIDGQDVEPASCSSNPSNDFGIRCRIYNVNGVPKGLPPADWIIDAVEKAGATKNPPEQ